MLVSSSYKSRWSDCSLVVDRPFVVDYCFFSVSKSSITWGGGSHRDGVGRVRTGTRLRACDWWGCPKRKIVDLEYLVLQYRYQLIGKIEKNT